MLKQIMWSPDVCKCVFIYEYDDELPENQRRHSFVALVERGPELAHQNIPEEELYNIVLQETRLKEQTRELVLQLNPSLNPNQAFGLWRFDSQRSLHITSPNLTDVQKSQLRAMSDTAFGAGKVLVE